MQSLNYILDDDIAAIATALAPSALGIIRTSGPKSIEHTARFFSRPETLLKADGHTLVYGWVHDAGVNIDEVMLCIYRAPHSNTGENTVEIICHGGPAVVKAVYNLCIKNGFRPAERGEFTFRSFIHGKTDLTRAEAVREMIDSKTGTGCKKAAGRLSGAVFRRLERIKSELLTALASLAVEIEYPEDETSGAGSFDEQLFEQSCTELRSLAVSWQNEKIYQNGIKIVLAGKTNAGKSSLFNALLKEDRAIVSDIHGTTRDWLEADLDFNGIPVKLFDTAGIRDTGDSIEAIGVQRSIALIGEADIALYLIDGTKPPAADDITFIAKAAIPLILVHTKSDKGLPETLPPELHNYRTVAVSAKTGDGLERLTAAVTDMVIADRTLTTESSVSLGTLRQRQAVESALSALEHAQTAAASGYPLDAVIQDVEDAVHTLGEITGEVRSDDILDRIFSDFCVGK